MAQNQESKGAKSSTQQRLKGSAQDVYTWWSERTSIRKGDPARVVASKIAFRVVGTIALIAASPMLVLALIVAFLVAL